MRILGIDTALGACSVALLDEGRVAARAWEEMQRGHAEALAPMTDALMRGAGASFADLDRIAVTTGPGTFTGQRVGLAFARALALALKIPAVGVTTLDALAAQAIEDEGASTAIAVCDAKRDEVYLGARDSTGAILVTPSLVSLTEALRLIEDLAAKAAGPIALAGTGADLMRRSENRLSTALVTFSGIRQPDAVHVARLGRAAPNPEGPPKPLYLRAPDAKLPAQRLL